MHPPDEHSYTNKLNAWSKDWCEWIISSFVSRLNSDAEICKGGWWLRPQILDMCAISDSSESVSQRVRFQRICCCLEKWWRCGRCASNRRKEHSSKEKEDMLGFKVLISWQPSNFLTK